MDFLSGIEPIYPVDQAKRLKEMNDLALAFGADRYTAKRDMEDCLKFENQLIDVSILKQFLKKFLLTLINRFDPKNLHDTRD